MQNSRFHFRLEKNLANLFNQKSKKTGLTKSNLIRTWIDNLEGFIFFNYSWKSQTITTEYGCKLDKYFVRKIDFFSQRLSVNQSEFLRLLVLNNVDPNLNLIREYLNSQTNIFDQIQQTFYSKLRYDRQLDLSCYLFNIPYIDDQNIAETNGITAEKVLGDVLRADKIYSFGNIDKYYEIFPGTRKLWAESHKTNPRKECWELLVDSNLARHIAALSRKEQTNTYYPKFYPKLIDSLAYGSIDCFVFDNDKIKILNLNPANPSAVTLQSQGIAQIIKTIHYSTWQSLTRN